MKYVSSWGLGFGVDRKPISKEDIEKQLKMKEGVYCLLFSTRCLAAGELAKDFKNDDVLSKWTISYAEWLKLNKPYSTEEELLDNDGTEGCGGIFTVHGHSKLKNAPTTIELELFLRNGNWVLTNTPNHLGN